MLCLFHLQAKKECGFPHHKHFKLLLHYFREVLEQQGISGAKDDIIYINLYKY